MNQKLGLYRKHSSVVLCLFIIVSFSLTSSSFAQSFLQRVEIPSSFNPVGSGARALGMGGAFIAIADDATAASWNPGGLIQLEKPEVSIVGAYFHRTEDNSFGTNPEASGDQSVSDSKINYLSAAYPFVLLGKNMIISLNYQHLYDLKREWNFPLNQSKEKLSLSQNVGYEQDGGLSTIGVSYCFQLNPNISFGLTLNLWEDGIYDNGWEQKVYQTGFGSLSGNAFIFESSSLDRYSFSGVNVNLGTLWHVTSKFTIGAVLKTPFTADIEHELVYNSSINLLSLPGGDSTSSESFKENEELDMPMSYGLGIAYRFSDVLTASLDIYRTEWNNFILEDAHGNKTSPISGKPEDASEVDPTHQLRMGVEYLFTNSTYVVPLHGGVFYDPAPAEGSPDDFYGFSLGTGLVKGRFVFDIAYQYRFGNDVGDSIMQNLNFSQDVDEHTIYSSLIVHL